ncbi:MAG TPA: metallophosphoesterase, partial [Halobacteriales archaeon]|nr:metallophosphoesterase [Halobacteriales archaeon]
MAPQVFDRSLLPEADFEFVLLSDTHYMLEDAEAVEFDSRRLQTSRTAHALELAAALDPAFVVHLGDLVQEFPGSDGFDDAIAEAERQFRGFPADVHHVAGNHDVGDKPDPTMPTQPVTEASLQAYHDRFGSSWYS